MFGVSRHERRKQSLLDPHPLSYVGTHMGPWDVLSPCGGRGGKESRLRSAGSQNPLAQSRLRRSDRKFDWKRGQPRQTRCFWKPRIADLTSVGWRSSEANNRPRVLCYAMPCHATHLCGTAIVTDRLPRRYYLRPLDPLLCIAPSG
jgi:hypothetical protein